MNGASSIRQWHHRYSHARCPSTEDRLHLVNFDQFFGCQHGCVGLGLAVFSEELEFDAASAACRVYLIDGHANCLLHSRAIRATRAGNGAQGADLEYAA